MKKPIVYMLVGLQGSGKSTVAKRLSDTHNATILNADTIRKQNPDWANDKVFTLLYTQMRELVSDGRNVILDNTNTTIKMRGNVHQNLKGIDCYIVAIILTTPYQTCVERLKERNRTSSQQVPLDALQRYYEGYQIPFEEWFEDIVLADVSTDFNCLNQSIYKDCCVQSRLDAFKRMINFNQNNPYHKFNLFEHSKRLSENYLGLTYMDNVMREASLFHDIGKLFTQKIGDDGNAHYPNHQNVGAYYMLENSCILYNDYSRFEKERFVLDVLFYINYHMTPFGLNSEKSIEKWSKIFGQEKYAQLVLFNEYDKIASGTEI